MNKAKVLLVDDQQLILDGIRVLVESENDFEVIGTAYTGEAAVLQIGRAHV